jgi:hypothetical protein
MRPWLWTALMASAALTSGLPACSESSKCLLHCYPAPPGCHVEGANSSMECSQASCGTIVCGPSDAGSDAGTSDARE